MVWKCVFQLTLRELWDKKNKMAAALWLCCEMLWKFRKKIENDFNSTSYFSWEISLHMFTARLVQQSLINQKQRFMIPSFATMKYDMYLH